jgi:hypothetical protein
VVWPVIDDHVVAARHVALHTIGTGANVKEYLAVRRLDRFPFFTLFLVKVMSLGVILTGPMALKTEIVPLLQQFSAVHIVAVAAAHVPMVHLALCERSVNINLFQDLSICKIEAFGEKRRQQAVE